MKKGDWGKAEEYFKQVLVDEPNSADVYYHLGDVYRFEGNIPGAGNI
jgi:tetratricopeptide (TPR) repeat protein